MSVETAVKPSLTLKRRLKASPAKVFAAWTDPEKIKRWMGPGEIVTVRAESDPREGGRYLILMRSPNGEPHNVGGVYREVIANEKAGVHLGLAIHTGTRIAGHRAAQTGWGRYAAHLDA